MSKQDFTVHCQKSDHKHRENAQSQHSPNGYDNHLVRTVSLISVNDTKSVNGGQRFQLESTSSRSSLSIDNLKVSNGRSPPTPPVAAIHVNLGNCINVGHISRAVTAKIIDLTNRTVERISNEKQILELLTGYSNEIDSSVRLVPFGSTTYGFGGAQTNLNILIDSSKRNTIQYSQSTITKSRRFSQNNSIYIYFRWLNSRSQIGIALIR